MKREAPVVQFGVLVQNRLRTRGKWKKCPAGQPVS